jgi:uncharacterized cupin superfamily protein
MPAGSEAPRHVHDNEDVTFIIQSGELIFFLGENVVTASRGDVIFAPRGLSHHFKITTPSCKATIILTPGNLDQYFWQSSYPFDENEFPGMHVSPEEMQGMRLLAERYGMRML